MSIASQQFESLVRLLNGGPSRDDIANGSFLQKIPMGSQSALVIFRPTAGFCFTQPFISISYFLCDKIP